jgi:type VI protein secretion system component Hcp
MFAGMILVVSFASFAAAQGSQDQEKKGSKESSNSSTITIQVADLTCTTPLGSGTFSAAAYSFAGAQESSLTSGGSGAGKATISPLNISKLFDECSPSLFGAVVIGKHFPTVDLTQADSKGNPILKIHLEQAAIDGYSIGGSKSSDSPQENIQIDFRKICISDPSTGSKLCYDRVANTTS